MTQATIVRITFAAPTAITLAAPEAITFAAPAGITYAGPSHFTEQPSTLAQWRAFRNKLPNTECPAKISEIVPFLAEFLHPIARACANGEGFDRRWSPGGPWTAGS